ncbi:MAG: hypothetical protein K6T71_02195 [Candidatus Bipolaricaulota bacterium]|nr:hypothetical protein [Candidatus Bipolaricaulota bacterium]
MRIRLPLDWLFVFGLTVSVYTAANFVLPRVFENFFATYVFQPLFLILLAVLIARLPGQRAAGKLSGRPLLVKIALAAALFQIYLAVVAGFFEKFGHSPYSLTPRGVVTNLVYVGAGLAGAEFSRAWLINRLCRKPAVFLPFLIALLYTVFSLPFSQFAVLRKTVEEAVQFFGSTFLPLFAENLLASVFAMWGGALPALAYRGVLQAFYWFSPVLPDLNWAMKALVGTVVPVVGVVVVQQVFLARAHPGRFRKQAGGGLVWWVGSVSPGASACSERRASLGSVLDSDLREYQALDGGDVPARGAVAHLGLCLSRRSALGSERRSMERAVARDGHRCRRRSPRAGAAPV